MKMDAVEFAERLTEAMEGTGEPLTFAQFVALRDILIRWSNAREAGDATYSVAPPNQTLDSR